MTEINLLPRELAPNKNILKLAKKLTFAGIFLAVLFFIFLGSATALFLFYSSKLKSESIRRDSLIKSIKALESTEQKVVLIKDRVAKASEVFAQEVTWRGLENFENLATGLNGVSVSNVAITPTGTTISISAGDSLSVSAFMNRLTSLGIYQNVVLSSFSYSIVGGYEAIFKLTNKV